MAKSVAVLDWKDIQELMKLCSMSVDQKNPQAKEFEESRQDLITSYLTYLHEWLPGREIDNDTRRPLIASLQRFSDVLRKGIISDLERDAGDSPFQAPYNECLRIKHLLDEVIRRTESSQPSSGAPG